MNCRLCRSSAVSLVTLLILNQLLIVPMVFHMLINRRGARQKRVQSSDRVDNQSLGRSCVRFPRSRAVRSCGMSCVKSCDRSRAKSHDESRARSRDESRARSCDESHARLRGGDFPGSCGQRFLLVVGR